MARTSGLTIKIGTAAPVNISTFGFNLVLSPNILQPPLRDYETISYPETGGEDIYPVTSYLPFDYTLSLSCIVPTLTSNAKIYNFYMSLFTVNGGKLTALPLEIVNLWTGVKIVGLAKSYSGGDKAYTSDLDFIAFDLTIGVSNPSLCVFKGVLV